MDQTNLNHDSLNSAFLGVGSNLFDPLQQVKRAIELVHDLANSNVVAKSSYYASAPVGYLNQPDFVNAVCQITTLLSPERLFTELKKIENQMGRVQTNIRFGPRCIDLDILLYGNRILSTNKLTIPHPRMHVRRFVLEPLIEIEENIQIPNLGKAAEHLQSCQDQELVRLVSEH